MQNKKIEHSQTKEDLISKISLNKHDIFYDEKPINNDSTTMDNRLNLVKFGSNDSAYFGYGSCCNGHFTRNRLIHPKTSDENLKSCLIDYTSTPFPIYDLLPVILNHSDSRFVNSEGLLAAGNGCNGGGIILCESPAPYRHDIVSKEIVSINHYEDIVPKNGLKYPRFRIENEKIFLDVYIQERDEKHNFGPIKGPILSKDITQWLWKDHVKIEETIELNKDCKSLRRPFRKPE
jgi:hypothetical protein